MQDLLLGNVEGWRFAEPFCYLGIKPAARAADALRAEPFKVQGSKFNDPAPTLEL
jgi:hypothetical protein